MSEDLSRYLELAEELERTAKAARREWGILPDEPIKVAEERASEAIRSLVERVRELKEKANQVLLWFDCDREIPQSFAIEELRAALARKEGPGEAQNG